MPPARLPFCASAGLPPLAPPADGGVGISCLPLAVAAAAAGWLSAFGGLPAFLGLARAAPGVATTRALLAGAAPLAGLALLPLVVLAIASAKSELSARRKR